MCVCILCVYHLPSIFTLTHSLRSFAASPVQSYGGNARFIFYGGLPPLWSIERSSRRWGAVPPEIRRLVAVPPQVLRRGRGLTLPAKQERESCGSELTNERSE